MKFYTYFSNQQRLAVIVLMLIIVGLEIISVAGVSLYTDSFEVDPQTYLKFQKEVDSLNAKLNVAYKNKPIERQAQIVANSIVNRNI